MVFIKTEMLIISQCTRLYRKLINTSEYNDNPNPFFSLSYNVRHTTQNGVLFQNWYPHEQKKCVFNKSTDIMFS